MGLDAVEIVTDVEDAFGITIEDAEAAKTVTPGQLIDLVFSKVERTADEACPSQRAFYRLRAALMERLGVPRNQIRPNVSLGTLFPRSTRKEDAAQIAQHIGLGNEMKLCRPAWLTRRIEFPVGVSTAGQLSRWIAVNAPDAVKAQPGRWSRQHVAEIVRAIVIDQLGCEQAYREDAHFVKDLGMA